MVKTKKRGSGLAQIIIGILVSTISFFMHKKNGESKFTLFLFVGGIFLVYGVLKLGFFLITKPKKLPDASEAKEIFPKKIEAFKKGEDPHHTHHMSILACHTCNTKHYAQANYCQMCGTRLNK